MIEGAEKINKRILEEARSQAGGILAEAEKRSDAIIDVAKKEANKRKKQIRESFQKKIEEQKKRILGIAELEGRKEILAAKQKLIEDVFQGALHQLSNLEEAAYFRQLRQMLLASIKTGEETIVLSSRDKERIPAQFWEDLNQELVATGRRGQLSLAQETPPLEGGFILQCGGVEINNSFKALLTMQRDELEPEVAALLFKER